MACLVGAAWAYYNYTSTGGARGEEQLRPLVWTIFSTPFVLWIGWVVARWSERWLAAFACFCLYFFTPFVGARIETLLYPSEQAAHMGHHPYFVAVMILHVVAGVGLTLWRTFTPVSAPSEQLKPVEGENLSSP